jgi:hypothetical protein
MTAPTIPSWFDEAVAQDEDACFAEDAQYAVWIENGGTDDDFVRLQRLLQTLDVSVEDDATEPKPKRKSPRLDPVKSAAKMVEKNPALVVRVKQPDGSEIEIAHRSATPDSKIDVETPATLRRLIQ